MFIGPHLLLPADKARHVGEAVAMVVAETLAQALDGAEAVEVDYEVLPAVADPAQAQEKSAPQIHEVAPGNTIYQWHLGDAKAVEQAFKSAAHVTKLRALQARLAQARAALRANAPIEAEADQATAA